MLTIPKPLSHGRRRATTQRCSLPGSRTSRLSAGSLSANGKTFRRPPPSNCQLELFEGLGNNDLNSVIEQDTHNAADHRFAPSGQFQLAQPLLDGNGAHIYHARGWTDLYFSMRTELSR